MALRVCACGRAKNSGTALTPRLSTPDELCFLSYRQSQLPPRRVQLMQSEHRRAYGTGVHHSLCIGLRPVEPDRALFRATDAPLTIAYSQSFEVSAAPFSRA